MTLFDGIGTVPKAREFGNIQRHVEEISGVNAGVPIISPTAGNRLKLLTVRLTSELVDSELRLEFTSLPEPVVFRSKRRQEEHQGLEFIDIVGGVDDDLEVTNVNDNMTLIIEFAELVPD